MKNQAAEVSQSEVKNRLQILKNELESKKSQLETEKANQKNLAEKILKLQESVSEVRETLVKQEVEQNEFMKKVDENEKELKTLGEQEYRLNQDRISLKFGLKFKYIKLRIFFSHFFYMYFIILSIRVYIICILIFIL